MKRLFAVLLLAFMLLATCVLADEDSRAATWRDAALLSAPLEGAQELMHYYGGTRVQVVREVDTDFVQVNVGEPGGSLMGYMERRFLVFGEEAIRKIYPEHNVYANQGWTLYSYCDPLSGAISENNDAHIYAIGENEDWVHAIVTAGDEEFTGFVSKAEAGLNDELSWMTSKSWIYTTPLEGELTVEEAIAYAKEVILAEGTMANAQENVPVTREMLDSCRVHVDVQWDLDKYYAGALSDEQIRTLGISRPETEPPLFYLVTFFYTDRTWEDGFPMICALACLYVEGDEVVYYDFGKG